MIDGTYNVIFIKIDGVFLPVGLQTSDSFEESVETIDTTTRDNAGWKTSRPTNQNYNISFEGLIMNTNFTGGDSTKVSLDKLRVLKRARTKIEWKTQDDALTFVDSGYGYITSLSKSTNIDEFISFSASIEGFGAPISTSLEEFDLQSELQYTL
tara:strand:- start:294 stop:755 length:462 start_codon:yes stop_codon:yes gene_type:complete